MRHKKAFINDLIMYILAIFLMAIVFIVLYYVVTQVSNSWNTSSALSNSMVQNFKNRFASVWDRNMLIIVIGYFIVILILAYFLRSYPVFAWLAVLVMLIFGMIAVYLANSWYGFATSPAIATAANDFAMTVFIMRYLPHMILGFGAIFIIIMYSKGQQGGGAL